MYGFAFFMPLLAIKKTWAIHFIYVEFMFLLFLYLNIWFIQQYTNLIFPWSSSRPSEEPECIWFHKLLRFSKVDSSMPRRWAYQGDAKTWRKATKIPVSCTVFTVVGLQEQMRYHVRVWAVNEKGVGEPTELAKGVLAIIVWFSRLERQFALTSASL